jgi:hypothetical protein
VAAAETGGGGPLTMGDALAELLADITEAPRTVGRLVVRALRSTRSLTPRHGVEEIVRLARIERRRRR